MNCSDNKKNVSIPVHVKLTDLNLLFCQARAAFPHSAFFIFVSRSFYAYDDTISELCTKSILHNTPVRFKLLIGTYNQEYEFDPETMTQTNVETNAKSSVIYHLFPRNLPSMNDLSCCDESLDPIYLTWDRSVSCHFLKKNTFEYQQLKSFFTSRLFVCANKMAVFIWKIVHFKAKLLYESFESTMQHPNKNEQLLFHGTSSENISPIIVQGYDCRLQSKHGHSYGKGVYFSPLSIYSKNYCENQQDPNIHHIFINSVLIGKYTKGEASLTFPPRCEEKHDKYDSVADQPEYPLIHCVFDNNQALPLYLVSFCSIEKESYYSQQYRSFPLPAHSTQTKSFDIDIEQFLNVDQEGNLILK